MKKYIFCLIAVAAMFSTTCKDDDKNDPVVPVTGVIIEQAELLISPGINKIMRAVIAPDNATNKGLIWSSSNETVAKIDPVTGQLAPLTLGSAVITVTTDDGGFSASCNIRVTNVPVTGIMLPETEVTLAPGAKKILTATVLSAAATNKSVTWSSDNEAVAVINSTTGELIANAVGKANITATTVENGFTASCIVNVVAQLVWNGFDIIFQDYFNDIVNQGVPLDQLGSNTNVGQNVPGYVLPDLVPLKLGEYDFQFTSNFYREQTPGFVSSLCGNITLEYCIQLKNNAPADSYVEFPELPNVGKLTVYGYCPNATNDMKIILQEKGVGNNVWNNKETGYLYSLTPSGKDRMYVFTYSSNVPVTLRLSRDPSTNFLGRIFRIVVEKY